MKIALITTTINVPKVLALYRKLWPEVAFFVAADEKTPLAAYEFCADIPNCEIYSPDRQSELGYVCSELLGWSCVERRNIALLEAVKWGAEVIVTIDDDNSPFDRGFIKFEEGLDGSLAFGLKVSSPTGWFDPGALLVPQTKHRGFPTGVRSEPVFEPVLDAKIGIMQGLCLGDPDIDAVTRIATAPIIHSVSELGRAGVVVDPNCKTVFNTQNTAFIRELAPAMFQPPGLGRYSDIYASLICQRVMRDRGLHVHFGQPFIWQQRNQHNLIGDLRLEVDGMENVIRFAGCIDNISFEAGASIIDHVAQCIHELSENGFYGDLTAQCAMNFLADLEKVL